MALLDNDGVDLDDMGVTSSMVYWADLLYAEPLPAAAAQSQEALEVDGTVDGDDTDMSWLLDVDARRSGLRRRGRARRSGWRRSPPPRPRWPT